MARLAVLGAGVMGTAILTALVEAGAFGAADVRAATLDEASQRHLADEVGVRVVAARQAVVGADVVVVAVKPGEVGALLEQVRDELPEDALLTGPSGTSYDLSVLLLPAWCWRLPPDSPGVAAVARPDASHPSGKSSSAVMPRGCRISHG